jgi:alkanesulfonate monooxygenase SsuD/methylene tetrahydromethanopterin reductase-like flavin-dependent oxidoreductase (luciferase family)
LARGIVGVQVAAEDAPSLLRQIEQAERLGIGAVWITSEGFDGLTVFAAAAVQTERVLLGTAIVRAATRHPIGLAQQAATIAQLAPGRLRLGVGPVHPGQAGMYGQVPQRPLAHLRAYIESLRTLLATGVVEVEKDGVTARGRLAGGPYDVPILASALRRGSFRFCGEVTDGAITWICPLEYVRVVAVPALRAGAAAAGRQPPRVLLHVPVALSDDAQSVREAMRGRYSFYLRNANYLKMFAEAGFPETAEGQWSDGMVDAVAVYGSEVRVADRLEQLLESGDSDLLVSAVGVGSDSAASETRVLGLLGDLARKAARS